MFKNGRVVTIRNKKKLDEWQSRSGNFFKSLQLDKLNILICSPKAVGEYQTPKYVQLSRHR